MILLADIGATNARFSITESFVEYSLSDKLNLGDYNSLEDICLAYLTKHDLLQKVDKAVLGVAAPVINDEITFVNADISFRASELKKKLFKKGLTVINDLALQAHAVKRLEEDEIIYIGKKIMPNAGTRILIAPGTGLGLAGITNNEVISTEAGHINISDKVLRPTLKKIVDSFVSENTRVPTYEDFLSGKGISFFYKVLSGNSNSTYTNEDILQLAESDEQCKEVKNLLNYLLASYLRYVTLVWGASGGVYLSGSIANTLLDKNSHKDFREIFEDSETMNEFLTITPLILIKLDDIGFRGALEVAKEL